MGPFQSGVPLFKNHDGDHTYRVITFPIRDAADTACHAMTGHGDDLFNLSVFDA